MLCDLAVRKLSPGTSNGSSCQQPSGTSSNSPRRLRRPASRTPTGERDNGNTISSFQFPSKSNMNVWLNMSRNALHRKFSGYFHDASCNFYSVFNSEKYSSRQIIELQSFNETLEFLRVNLPDFLQKVFTYLFSKSDILGKAEPISAEISDLCDQTLKK